MASTIEKTEFQEVVSNGVDFKNRRIYFGLNSDGSEDSRGGEFKWESVEVVIRALHKMASDYKHAPIELHMSSYGGETDEMLRLYDAIQICPCQVKFYGSGKIMSSAALIMAGCDERYLTPNSQIMLHSWRGRLAADNEIEMRVELDHASNWLTNKFNQIFADNSRMPAEFWSEVTKRDLYLSPEETIQLGLADEIVPFKKRGNLRRKRISKLNQNMDKGEMKKIVNDIHKRIYRGKNLKIELHIPEEEFDKDIYVDENAMYVEEVLMKDLDDSSNQLSNTSVAVESKDLDSSE